MKYVINLNALTPMRAEASDKSEMITQILFGEFCEVLQIDESYTKVKNHFDGYEGWIDSKMLTLIPTEDFLKLSNAPIFRVSELQADIFCLTDKSIYHLPAGSFLPNYDLDSNKFGISNLEFQIHPSYVSYIDGFNLSGIIQTALPFINSPYLWGGKSMLGIDCSGLVQTVFALNGIQLPRDASLQISRGINIAFDDIQPGDLLFFGKNNKITHVGIYLGDDKIIHASGKVKKSLVDSIGIKNDNSSEYTHYLSAIRRIEY